MNQLIEVISKITGQTLEIIKQEQISKDSLLTFCDTNALENLVNFKPQVELEQGIAATIEWASKSNVKSHLGEWIQSTQ